MSGPPDRRTFLALTAGHLLGSALPSTAYAQIAAAPPPGKGTAMQTTTPPAQLQQLSSVPCTGVLVFFNLKSGIPPAEIAPHMAEEVRDTVQLYLEGHITSWWTQCDAVGVVFLFASTSVDEVRGLMAGLPLVKSGLVDLTFTRVGPLGPLKMLMR